MRPRSVYHAGGVNSDYMNWQKLVIPHRILLTGNSVIKRFFKMKPFKTTDIVQICQQSFLFHLWSDILRKCSETFLDNITRGK